MRLGAKVRRTCRTGLVVFFSALILTTTITTTTAQRCGCNACNESILNLTAGDKTCEEQINDRIAEGFNETDACQFAAEKYPLACNPGCHPDKCDRDVPPLCNCETCTPEVWNAITEIGFTCGQWIVFRGSVSQLEDCQAVAELHDECAPCNPLTCGPNETAVPSLAPMPIVNSLQPTTVNGTIPSDKPQTSQPTFAPFGVTNPDAPCGCFACDETVLSTVVLGFSCQERIDYLQTNAGGNLGYLESCKQVAESFDNNICGPACHPELCNTMFPTSSPTRPEPEMCTCYDCNQTVLNTTVAGFTCADRIRYLQTSAGGKYEEEAACDFVAREFQQCWSCGPDFCDGRYSAATVTHVASWVGVLLGALALLLL